MKILKFLFFLLLIVVIGGTIYYATQDGSYQIEETMVISAPKEVVYNTVNDYKTWEEWGPWKAEDPTMVISYPEKTKGEGASFSWQGEMDGSMKTTKAIPGVELQQDLTLVTPAGERQPEVYWHFKATDAGSTAVTWGMKGEHTLLDKAYYGLTGMDFNGQMKEMYDNGLEALKNKVETDVRKFSIIDNGITEHSGGFYLYRTTSAKAQTISEVMGQNYGGIMQFMNTNNIKQDGMPFTIYNEMMGNGDVIMTNAIPVSDKVIVAGNINVLSGFMPRTAAYKVTLKGNYDYLGDAWTKALQLISESDYEQDPTQNVFEVYATDPGEVPNPAEWITELYIPIKGIN